jgi:hypothetical protein
VMRTVLNSGGARRRVVLAGLACLLPALAVVLGSVPASAADGSSSVTCATGDSCTIQLDQMVQFGGLDYSPGASNLVINIAPPPCMWNPIGNAQTGSQYIISSYGGMPPVASDPFDQLATYQQARQLLATTPMPAGEWYWLPVVSNPTPAQIKACDAQPLYFWDVPGAALPGITVPPVTLGQLAMSKLKIPGAGAMYLSPRTGVSYSNLPVFVRVTLNGAVHIGPGGLPYLTDWARLGGTGATVWAEGTPLQLTSTDTSAQPETSGCGYLGSAEMIHDPGAVASTGANGTADCGITFRQPGTWNIAATMTWRTCWVPEVVPDSPPPASCQPVPGASLNPVNWNRPVAVHEIQAANGAG